MFKNYLIIAIRNIIRKKVSSIINILGLAIGIAIAIIIFLWIRYESGYAKCFENHNLIYLAYGENNYSSGITYSGVTSTALGPALYNEFPEIEKYARTSSRRWMLGTEDKKFSEVGTPTDSTFLSMYSIEFIQGNPKEVFSDIHNIILSESFAKRIFGDEDPMFRTINVNGRYNATITGIYEDFPKETHFYTNYEYFVPFEIFEEMNQWNTNEWGQRNYQTYIQLSSKNVDIKALKDKIAGIKQKYVPESKTRIRIKPITRMHIENLEGGGLITYINIMSIVAIFIVIIACINYLNLATALSVNRSREIGMRKVIGADRKKLITQFLTESTILAIIAVNFAVIIVQLSLPFINEALDKELSLSYNLFNIVALLGAGVIIGLLAGIYPAIIQSSFNAVQSLRGTFSGKTGQLYFRKLLVTFQFFLSVLVIIIGFNINKQIQFIMNKDLGYHKENIISMTASRAMGVNSKAIQSELLASPYVVGWDVSNTTMDHRESSIGGNSISWEGQESGHSITRMGLMGVYYGFNKMYEIGMAEGRFFSEEFMTDANQSCIINETAVKEMGITDPIGKKIKLGRMERTIIGVINDFHYRSLHDRIEPLAILLGWAADMISIRVDAENEKEAIDFVMAKLKEIIPNESFDYEYLEHEVNDLYAEEERVKLIMGISSVLAIFISCLGLFGLSAFVVERRYKEIGIRKVNGASMMKIASIFLKDFMKLVLLAIVLAFPSAYYLSLKWLDNFAYKIELSWITFGIAGITVILVALITVSIQIYAASRRNPVDILRYE